MTAPATPWQDGYEPADCPVFAHNELHTSLSPDQLWPMLIAATAWPQ
jgi:hypothetical protein